MTQLTKEEIEKRIDDSYELPNKVIESVPNPIISVRTSTYQHVDYIRECIESILMQRTTFPFEYIIGEDFSTDGTREIVFEYAKKYPDRIRVITADYNVGMKANGMRCERKYKGKYIALCEGDDYWTDPLKLQKQVDFLEANPDFSLCFHNALILWEDKSQPPKYFCSKDQKEVSTIEDVIEKWFIPSASMVLRKEYITPLPDWFKDIYNGDYALHLLLASKGKIKYIDEVMSVYRRALGSLSYNPKITTDFVSKSIINLLNYIDKETNFKYNELILRRTNAINKKNKEYYFKKKHPILFHVKYPMLTFGKILRDVGLYIISKRVK